MVRYVIAVIALLFSCGAPQFNLNQDAASDKNSSDKKQLSSSTMTVGTGDSFEVFRVEITDKKLDILIVVDNSTTMNHANMELKEKIAPLLSEISASDWQIVVTTSTITDCLRGIMKKNESDLGKFKDIIGKVHSQYLSQNDLASSNNEQVVKMARRALAGMPLAKHAGRGLDIDCRGAKQHWLRPNSLLVVLMITDEDAEDPTHPHNGLPPSDPQGNPSDYRCEKLSCIDDFYAHLSTLRVPHVSAKIYGILDKSNNGVSPRNSSYNRSDLYLQWRDAKDTKPLFDYHHALYQQGTAKLNDFNVVFKKISADMSSSLRNTFVLKNSYDTSTAKVILTKADNSTVELSSRTYKINDKTLVIDADQLVGAAQVRIQR